jgi:hypothetical protein
MHGNPRPHRIPRPAGIAADNRLVDADIAGMIVADGKDGGAMGVDGVRLDDRPRPKLG